MGQRHMVVIDGLDGDRPARIRPCPAAGLTYVSGDHLVARAARDLFILHSLRSIERHIFRRDRPKRFIPEECYKVLDIISINFYKSIGGRHRVLHKHPP